MATPIYVVDAFTSRPFTGNPAGICILETPRDDSWMQKVAEEMKHAETAFVTRREQGYDLRWFTPATEVDLCGHATLASAHVLWDSGRLGMEDPAEFHTKSGVLTCTRHGYGIQMDFPAEPADPARPINRGAILDALGIEGEVVGAKANRMDILVEVDTAAKLRALRPHLDRFSAVDARGIIVTAISDSEDYDFVSRFFAPAAGVPEDSVTGSAHCCLAPYWSEKLGKLDLVGYQCSPRGGTVRVGVRGDRVLLIGHAITVLSGVLQV